MLLVHGANRTLQEWLPMLEHLRGVHCVAYDVRGHGHSTPPPDDDYGFDAHLADLAPVSGLRRRRGEGPRSCSDRGGYRDAR
jgi:pimeloyl-ACP methyl ester carboxylesterase